MNPEGGPTPSKCRHCGASIYWVHFVWKNVPVDCEPVEGGYLYLTFSRTKRTLSADTCRFTRLQGLDPKRKRYDFHNCPRRGA